MKNINLQKNLLVSLLFCLVKFGWPVAAVANEAANLQLPMLISADMVKVLSDKGEQFILVNADKPISNQIDKATDIPKIYYTIGVSKTSAIIAVRQDRLNKKTRSQVLAGTPLEWQHLKLPINENVVPKTTLNVSPKALSEAIKDNEDILIIDLRDNTTQKDIKNNLFMGNSIHLLPHQVKEEFKNISKLRWTVLVDDGYGVASAQAEELRNAGYQLVAVLVGGYPAWAADTTK